MRQRKPEAVSLSQLFSPLPKALLGLPRAAYHATAESHHDGVLLLLSSLAMSLLAVSSFSLLRRLKRLKGQLR